MRYRGPKAKVMRRFGIALAPSPKYQRRKKVGAYGSRLTEKQKLRAFYGIAERQMRRHVDEALRRHNGRRVDIPSYQVRPGETVPISEKMKRSRQMAVWAERGAIPPPPYLELDRDHLSGRLVRLPDRDEIIPIDDRPIVEFYSR